MNFNKSLLLWTFLNLAIVLGFSALFFPFLDPDSCAYIEAARNLRVGQGLTYFTDSGREPLDLFPAGFSVLIYGFSFLKIEPAAAAILIPRLCFAVLPFLLFYILRFIVGDFIAFFVTVATVFMHATIFWSFLAMSDVPYLAMALLSFLFLFKAFKNIDFSKKLICYSLASGFAAGFALAIRNVGYSIPLAVGVGLTLGALLRLISWKFYRRILTSWGVGFILGYGPFLLRNFIVFRTWQPYKMDPSELSIYENIRYYLWALVESLTSYYHEYARVASVAIAGILGTSLFAVFKRREIILSHHQYPLRAVGAFILGFYLILGAVILILARSKYEWGEDINPRHLLQYNWIYLAGFSGAIAFLFKPLYNIKEELKFFLAAAALIVFLVPQWKMLSYSIQHYQAEELGRIGHLNKVSQYLQNLPADAYLISTPWPELRISSRKPIHGMYGEDLPAELVDKKCSRYPLAVILERRYVKEHKYLSWQGALDGKAPDGFQIKVSDPDFVILMHPKNSDAIVRNNL